MTKLLSEANTIFLKRVSPTVKATKAIPRSRLDLRTNISRVSPQDETVSTQRNKLKVLMIQRYGAEL